MLLLPSCRCPEKKYPLPAAAWSGGAVEAARAAQQQVGRSHRRRAAVHREREREIERVLWYVGAPAASAASAADAADAADAAALLETRAALKDSQRKLAEAELKLAKQADRNTKLEEQMQGFGIKAEAEATERLEREKESMLSELRAAKAAAEATTVAAAEAAKAEVEAQKQGMLGELEQAKQRLRAECEAVQTAAGAEASKAKAAAAAGEEKAAEATAAMETMRAERRREAEEADSRVEQAVEAARAAQQQVGRSHRRRAAVHTHTERERGLWFGGGVLLVRWYAVSHESSVTHEFLHAVPGVG